MNLLLYIYSFCKIPLNIPKFHLPYFLNARFWSYTLTSFIGHYIMALDYGGKNHTLDNDNIIYAEE